MWPPCIDVILQQRLEQIIGYRQVIVIGWQPFNGDDWLVELNQGGKRTVPFFCYGPFRKERSLDMKSSYMILFYCYPQTWRKRAAWCKWQCLLPVNREFTGSSGSLYTLHDVWERPPANNIPQTLYSAGAYGTGYVLFFIYSQKLCSLSRIQSCEQL